MPVQPSRPWVMPMRPSVLKTRVQPSSADIDAFIVAFSDGALTFEPIRLTVLERMLGLEQLGYSS